MKIWIQIENTNLLSHSEKMEQSNIVMKKINVVKANGGKKVIKSILITIENGESNWIMEMIISSPLTDIHMYLEEAKM